MAYWDFRYYNTAHMLSRWEHNAPAAQTDVPPAVVLKLSLDSMVVGSTPAVRPAVATERDCMVLRLASR